MYIHICIYIYIYICIYIYIYIYTYSLTIYQGKQKLMQILLVGKNIFFRKIITTGLGDI